MSHSAEFIHAFERQCERRGSDWSELEEVLSAALAKAAVRWPALDLSSEDFVTFLAARADPEHPVRWLREAPIADWAVVYAASRRDPLAIQQFAVAFLEPLSPELNRLTGGAADDVRQLVLERLFVGEPPGILRYAGRGALASWVRVAATRVALNLMRNRAPEGVQDEALLEIPGSDPDFGYLRQRYAKEVEAAFAPAFSALSARERMLLRQRFLDGLSIEALARLHGVHVATIARWLASAREALGSGVRQHLGARLKLSPSELESLVQLVRSQLDLNLSRLLESSADVDAR